MSIELYAYRDDDLSVLLRKAAQVRVFSDMVKDARTDIDGALADAVDRVSVQTGTAFTARNQGWSAVLTDPQPQPFVSDEDAFYDWWVSEPELADRTVTRTTVRVLNHERAAMFLRHVLAHDNVHDWSELFAICEETVLPDSPLEVLQNEYGYVVKDGRFVSRLYGDVVPGVSVRQAARQLRVSGKTEAKTRLRADLHAALGLKGIE